MERELGRLAALIKASNRIVFFTGAGISTESGIPDFRSPGGLWEKNQPIEFSDFLASEEMRRESWRRKFAMDSVMSAAEPNAGHLAITELYRRGQVSKVVTQNIDGLQQLAGVDEKDVIELHGNTTFAKCLDCGDRMSLKQVKAVFAVNETLPECGRCGGIVKTATISFGQPMPVRELQEAEKEAVACDLMIVAGSSLVVYPAADIPLIAREAGAELVIINREPTPLDPVASLTIRGEIGKSLSAVTKP
ncbi:SIR2 family NAD-dependent protein deacylase [Sneathiella chinensis]|uniref:protein acetyllysine N-acetyltransferase n=1 Tax=Sneathiella chinensis TaxID=349750 RepID=A0ABQ5U319_9PROT|nr:Sir2 family NAD-dependent protein deacetylase [Sneathiella chinensis]GLQ06570.1 NAD-dependent protein deacetylase 1 [Sneathiella chinensis]